MVKRALVWAAGNSRLQQQATENAIGRRVAHRFVAGERLDEALAAAAELNSRGSAASWTCWVRGSPIWPARRMRSSEYEDAVEAIAARGLDATISIKLSQLGQTVDRDACVANLNADPRPGAARWRRGRDRHGGQRPGLGHAARCSGTRWPGIRRPGWPSRRRCAARRWTWRPWRREAAGPAGQGRLRGAGRAGPAGQDEIRRSTSS